MMLTVARSDPPNGTFPPTGITSTLWPGMLPCYVPATHTTPSSPLRIPSSRCLPSADPSPAYPQTPTSSPSTRVRSQPSFHARLRNPHVGRSNAEATTTASSSGSSSSPLTTSASISGRPSATKRARRGRSHSDIHPLPLRRSPRKPKPTASRDYATVGHTPR